MTEDQLEQETLGWLQDVGYKVGRVLPYAQILRKIDLKFVDARAFHSNGSIN